MTRAEQNSRDDAIALAALPGGVMWLRFELWKVLHTAPYSEAMTRTAAALRRLKRAGLVRYVRETKRWERV